MTSTSCLLQFVNHICEPNARYITIRLDGSNDDVAFEEAIVDMPASTEVLADYAVICWVFNGPTGGWSVADPDHLVIYEYSTAICKG